MSMNRGNGFKLLNTHTLQVYKINNYTGETHTAMHKNVNVLSNEIMWHSSLRQSSLLLGPPLALPRTSLKLCMHKLSLHLPILVLK